MAKQQLYTVHEVASMFGCTHSRICQILRENKDIGLRPGREYLLAKSDLSRIKRLLKFKGKNFQKSA